MNLKELEALRDEKRTQVRECYRLMRSIRKNMATDDAKLTCKVLELGIEALQRHADDLHDLAMHVDEMMCEIGDPPTVEEVEAMLIKALDLWDQPF